MCVYLTELSWTEEAGVGVETLSSSTKATHLEMTSSLDSEANDMGVGVV